MALRVGVDVGGTNTDAVLMDDQRVVASVKVPTTQDVTTGIAAALGRVAGRNTVGRVGAVMIGTTHFTNAVVEARNLNPTAVVRIGAPATTAVPPLIDWPPRLIEEIGDRTFVVHGGYEYDARPISPLDESEIRTVAKAIRDAGVMAVAVTGVFSPLKDDQEKWVASLLEKEIPGIRVSISSELGRLGLLERENATVMNASLANLADDIVRGLRLAVGVAGLTAPVWMTQNDGTLMSGDTARRFPAATFASGPTNSIRGAALLANVTDCIVIDIGGTTTDIGVLHNGFPREASGVVEVGGVRTNFRMPDIVSIGIGGGSIVRTDPELTVGPHSVGYRLEQRARVFGGDTLTATDLAVAAGMAEIGDPALVADLDRGFVEDSLALIEKKIAEAVDSVKTRRGAVDATLVGGGSVIVGGGIEGISRLVRPNHHDVANAVGASIAQVGGEVDRVVSLEDMSRESAVESARAEARQRCLEAGGLPDTVRIVEVEEIPLTYLPSNAMRVRVKVVGDLGLET
ncbi:MAG: hydantoinase/oxoprolinase family protein [Acidimicrobiia bacterium]